MSSLGDRLRNQWIAEKLRELRLARGFTQATVAKLAGIKSRETVSGYECCDNVPTIERLFELLEALYCSPAEFFSDMPTARQFGEMACERLVQTHKGSTK